MDDQLQRLRARVPAAAQSAGAGTEVPVEAGVQLAPRTTPAFHRMMTTVLGRMGAKYIIDEGEITGIWDNGLFEFFQLGEDDQEMVVQIHGGWERILPEENYSAAALFANDWNSQNAWPKAYAQIEEVERVVGIFGETTVNFGADLTLDQLELMLNYGIGSALGLFDAAEKAFPDAELIG